MVNMVKCADPCLMGYNTLTFVALVEIDCLSDFSHLIWCPIHIIYAN